MSDYLNSNNYQQTPQAEPGRLDFELKKLLEQEAQDGILIMLGRFRQILGDNNRHDEWDSVHNNLLTLFKCGHYSQLDGPMIGLSMSIRDNDYFRASANLLGKERSSIAEIEWMAKMWNLTFANTGIWMGKTFEPVSRETVAAKCSNHSELLENYDAAKYRIGRNFFRQPHNPSLLHLLGLPVLTRFWNLLDRPLTPQAEGFEGSLLSSNLEREKVIPYSKTGGIFLAAPGTSVVPELSGKAVYQLNYRWPELDPAYPMTRLVDELVQIDDGVYLGQLVMATKNYSLGNLPGGHPIGSAYQHDKTTDYGYQNNGFFLMIDPERAKEAYADNVFSQLRPHPGEAGYQELGYSQETPYQHGVQSGTSSSSAAGLNRISDWKNGWRDNPELSRKFTSFCLEDSTRDDDGDVSCLREDGESILQMLQRIQGEISAQSCRDDHLRQFEKLNRLFRCGIAPKIDNGLFQGNIKNYNCRFDGLNERQWYNQPEQLNGFDYYHGATLNLHWGLTDNLRQGFDAEIDPSQALPTTLSKLLQQGANAPNFLNSLWAGIGRFIFPWSGKSFEKISGRKLSMLLDESSDLANRYPQRVAELQNHPSSWPHYDLVKKNAAGFWKTPGRFAEHLQSGSWDNGMNATDKQFWTEQAEQHWVYGNNTQDARIIAADEIMKMLDMNYRTPEQPLLDLAEAGPAPFVRFGYTFLGLDEQDSILPMNNGTQKKQVFQFHYRYPMIGGPAPIGTCLDEIVEIAEGLYLGQLIYATNPLVPFHSATDPADYAYQLFGYFLLLDNDWQFHRQAIGLDVLTQET